MTKTNFTITLKGQKEFTEEELYLLNENNIADIVIMTRSNQGEGTLTIKSDQYDIQINEAE
ncbi:hypothetical protein [Macrococcus carouselicus]|uniref:Uncharacterized protein n=1 Tax=Macrococcus carouselicus TaxID=69969 RepID=A0A9Q8CKD9_9STAP|nr:hypothetical protein [Macrococcus carouselicus]TDL94259.1 hypothetical protein ERX40_11015 [Macrococcus carouselicus]